MNISAPGPAVDAGQPFLDPDTIWYHPAFCQLALPDHAAPGGWRRAADAVALALESGAGQDAPAGWALRLVLMLACDRAVRTASPTVELGADAAALAGALGLAPHAAVLAELEGQAQRLLACKMTVALEGGAAFGVTDARGQSRRLAGEWRPRIRLSARFHASLLEGAVPLDRRIVATLANEAMALDAHGWIRHLLHTQSEPVTVAWDVLHPRFAAPAQDMDSFRAAFEDALRMVFAADVTIALAADDQGVTVGLAAAEPEPAAPQPPVAPSPRGPAVQAPAAQLPAEPSPLAQSVSAQAPAAQAAPAPPAAVEAPRPAVAAPEPAAPRAAEAAPGSTPITDDIISLRSQLTGLPMVVWLKRGYGADPVVIGVTPGARFDTDRLTVLMLEPLAMQVSGGLPQHEFDRVSAWAMANRDLIDLFWEDRISSFEEIASRIRKVPAPGWR